MRPRLQLAAAFAVAFVLPTSVLACACGCGVFDVGTSAMYASHAGFMGYLEYDYLDQDQNRAGTGTAPADQNMDKDVRTRFYTVGGHYLFNRTWGVSAELPYWDRDFTTTDEDTGELAHYTHGALGDVRLRLLYTGLSGDMSTGLSLGLKLPNGETGFAGFDADTQIGSGSTDLLLGAYHLGRITADNRWSWFVQGQWAQPLAHKSNYRPGAEGAVTAGAYFEGWGGTDGVRVSPVAQLRAVYRRADGGPDGHPEDTGYERVVVAPGLELSHADTKVYAEFALPVYTNSTGNQLFARSMWKLNVSHNF
jgi:hypothetical protein